MFKLLMMRSDISICFSVVKVFIVNELYRHKKKSLLDIDCAWLLVPQCLPSYWIGVRMMTPEGFSKHMKNLLKKICVCTSVVS